MQVRLRYWGFGVYQEFSPSSSPPLLSPFSGGSVIGGLSAVGEVGVPVGGPGGGLVSLPVVVCGGEGGEALVVVGVKALGGSTGALWGLGRRLIGWGGWRGVVG